MEEERREERHLRIIGEGKPGIIEEVEPGTNGASEACTVGNSDIEEASAEELAEVNGVDTGDKESGERESRERESGDRESGDRESGKVGEAVGMPYEIKVRILRSSRGAKFRHDPP